MAMVREATRPSCAGTGSTGIPFLIPRGRRGYLGHYDGTGWNHLNSQDGGPALWGSGTSDVWLIGLLGGNSACDSAPSVIIHWQGATSVPRDTQFRFGHALQGMWGNGASELWAVGDSGAIVHYNGSAWSLIPNYANLTFGVGQLVWRSLGSRRFGHSASFHAMNFTPLQSVGTL